MRISSTCMIMQTVPFVLLQLHKFKTALIMCIHSHVYTESSLEPIIIIASLCRLPIPNLCQFLNSEPS